jgi:DNA-binding transcriptional ArsR family regulator
VAQRVMDLTGRSTASPVLIESGPVPELLVSLCAYGLPSDHATFEAGPGWIEMIRTRSTPEFTAAFDRIGPSSGKAWVNLIGLAMATSTWRSVKDFLRVASSLSPMDARLYLLGYHVPAYQGTISRDVLRRAAEGDRRAIDVLVADGCYFGGEAGHTLEPLLRLSPEETKDLMVEVLTRWHHDVFATGEEDAVAILSRDADAKRAMAGTVSPGELIESASGIEFVPRPDVARVYLIPQIAMRPWVLLCEHDDTRLFCYPVTDESMGGDPDAPPGTLVRLHRALGDEKRIRILKAVATSAPTLQELADRFDVPKSTLHHHMAILRAAGLIRVTSDDERRYSVRFDVIPEASSLLDAYLRPSRSGSAGAPRGS